MQQAVGYDHQAMIPQGVGHLPEEHLAQVGGGLAAAGANGFDRLAQGAVRGDLHEDQIRVTHDPRQYVV